jgi:radical SAM superfamily enzyme YgiQ (UPF0313 family)
MEMKILFLNPPFNLVTEENGTSNYSSLGDKVMPYALLTGASFFRNGGFDVLFFDGSLHHDQKRTLENFLTQETPDIIITTLNCLAAFQTEHLIAQLKSISPFFSILWCNEPFIEELSSIVTSGDSFVYKDWLSASFELCQILSKPAKPGNVSGVYLRQHGTIVSNPRRCHTPLSVYPPPALDLVKVKKYNHHQVMLSEGCNFHCIFCHFGNRIKDGWGAKPVDKCIDEFKKLRSCGKRFIRIIDNELTSHKEFVKELLKRIIDEKLDIVWETNVRVNNIDEELVSLMSRSGCLQVGFGVESGVQEILDLNNKKITLKQILETARLFRKYNILTRAYFLIGLRGDTLQSIQTTHRFVVNEVCPDSAGLGIVIPYPETEYHTILKTGGFLKHISIRHVLWIYKNLYKYLFIDDQWTDKPGWRYENLSFDEIAEAYTMISSQLNSVGNYRKLMTILRHGVKHMAFLINQSVLNPSGIIRRLKG